MQGVKSKKQQHRKDKPWDVEGIDHWKIDPWTDEDGKGMKPFAEESMFATLFPKYREKYLQSVWEEVTQLLAQHGIDAELDLLEGSMTVKTTRRTRDPFIILSARDLIKLLARSVPLEKARTVLQDDVVCDVIKIGGIVRNKERFVKRRARLLGPNGNTLKALELLTDSYILVQGNTVCVMGSYKALKEVRRVVEECMKNVHPIYNIKRLMIKQQLAKDPKLAEENWDRFLPKFKKTSEPKKKKKRPRGPEKEKSLFPPAPMPRKEDLAMLSGQAFFKTDDPEAKKKKKKEKKKRKMEKQQQQEEQQAQHDEAVPAMLSAPGTKEFAEMEKARKRRKGKRALEGDDADEFVAPDHLAHRSFKGSESNDQRSALEIASRLMAPESERQALAPKPKQLKGEPEKGIRHQMLDEASKLRKKNAKQNAKSKKKKKKKGKK